MLCQGVSALPRARACTTKIQLTPSPGDRRIGYDLKIGAFVTPLTNNILISIALAVQTPIIIICVEVTEGTIRCDDVAGFEIPTVHVQPQCR